LYKTGKYEQAIDAYGSVLKTNKHSSELYFNLGNCYYKLNKVAAAIYNYEKALLLSPNDSEILGNLKFAQKRTIDEVKVVPKVGFAKLLRDFTGFYHYNTWAWIAVGLAISFLLAFLVYYFSQTTILKRISFFVMFALVFVILTVIAAAVFEKSHYDKERPAIVFAEMSGVRSEPQKGSPVIFLLHEGTKVYVKEKVYSWKKVQLTDGTEGWIESNAIREVK
jgi:tetratricopeptide (TPR) repeat protein